MTLRDRCVSGRAVDVLRWIEEADVYVHLTPGPIGVMALRTAFEVTFLARVTGNR